VTFQPDVTGEFTDENAERTDPHHPLFKTYYLFIKWEESSG